MSITSRAKPLLRRMVLKGGSNFVWMVPGKQRRANMYKELARRHSQKFSGRTDHEAIVEEALEHPSDELTLADTLISANSARLIGRDDVSRQLLEACYSRVRTSSVLLADLADDRRKNGHIEEAQKFIAQAIILNPSNKNVVRAYLAVHMASTDPEPLSPSLLRRFKNDPAMVWDFCKTCRTPADFDEIHDALADTGELPLKHVRPYGNAALRAERFDDGRAQYLRAIEAAAEKRHTEPTPAKALGDAGTEALLDIVELLNSASVPHFAAAGTCLGIVREGRPLPHDNDIDIGILEKDFDQAALLDLTLSHPQFTTSIPHPKSPKIGLKHSNGAEIDLFKFYEEDGQIWHDGVFVRWGNTPFEYETRPVDGVDVTIPKGTEYLVENYGEAWNRPDPLFNAFINGPNRHVIWNEYYAAHLLREINLTIRRGNTAKAVSFMRDESNLSYLTQLERDVLNVIAGALENRLDLDAA